MSTPPLTILVVHNHYQQRGGEDSVFETECAMLRGAGHTVICYEKHNDEINSGEKRLAASGQRLEAPTAQVLGTRYQVLANTATTDDGAATKRHKKPQKETSSHTEAQRHRDETASADRLAFIRVHSWLLIQLRAFLCFSWQKEHPATSSTKPTSSTSPASRTMGSPCQTSTPTHPHTHTLSPENFSQSCQSCNPVNKHAASDSRSFASIRGSFSSFVRFVSFVVNKSSLFFTTIWNRTTYREITALIREHHPDVIHCHNTFPLISPSVYWAAARQGVPVVQTLHNYRLICINPYLYRGGRICEDCLGRSPLRGVIHRCYRGSLAASVTVAAMLIAHRLLGTYRNKVTTYIALTEFGRNKFIEARLCDPSKVVVKPNAVGASATAEAVPQVLGTRYQVLANTASTGDEIATKNHEKPQKAPSSHTEAQRHREHPAGSDSRPFASIRGSTHNADSPISNFKFQISTPATVLYAGRLSPEKGVDILIAAWKLFLAQSNQQPTTSSLDQQEDRNDSPASQLVPSTYPLVPSPSPAATLVPSTYHLVPKAQPRLHIIGDGPERSTLEAAAQGFPSVSFIGRLSPTELHAHMARASILVLPSRCYETFAMAVNEAAAVGTPAIVSNIGGQASIIEDGATGFTFRSGSAESLAETLAKALSDPARLAEMGRLAQARFLAGDCPPSHNLSALENVYTLAMKG